MKIGLEVKPLYTYIHGMEVEKGQTSSPSITSQLPAGVYQLKVNGNMYKVIKQGN